MFVNNNVHKYVDMLNGTRWKYCKRYSPVVFLYLEILNNLLFVLILQGCFILEHIFRIRIHRIFPSYISNIKNPMSFGKCSIFLRIHSDVKKRIDKNVYRFFFN